MIDVKKFRSEQIKPRRFLKLFIAVLCVLAVVIAVGMSISLFFQYVQMQELGEGFTKMFWTQTTVKITTQVLALAVIFLLVFGSVTIARYNLLSMGLSNEFLRRRIPYVLLSFVISFLLGFVVSNTLYVKLLAFLNPVWFGKGDPLFHNDIGYYIFQRPFLVSAFELLMSVWTFMTVFTAGMYLVFGLLFGGFSFRDMLGKRSVMIHNIINIALLLLLNCMTYKFRLEDILFGQFGELQGAGYTDVAVWMKYYKLAPIVLIAVIAAAIIFLWRKKTRNAVMSLVVYPIFWGVALLASIVVETMVVAPNEVLMESQYIADNISYTKEAYGLNEVEERDFVVANDLSPENISENSAALDSVRIIDIPSTLTMLNQIQGIRNYYTFHETDIVPYEINGEKIAVAITPREITKANMSDSADTYINRRLRYTHGFGLAMNLVNCVTSQGQPEFLIKDIPPKTVEGAPKITQPRIYYGELTNDYVVVNNPKYKELDYSEGQEDIEFTYDGNGGIPLTFFNRLMFAAKYGDFRLLVSDLVSNESRLLINRNIKERLEMAVPFLSYDNDPYMVIDEEGRLKWIVDAYTTSEFYPYAQKYGDFNYIRNSAKAVVDAYDGTVQFYITDPDDPMIQSYAKVFPSVFAEGEIPKGLSDHFKYPEQLFDIQAKVYAQYHLDNPTMFYNKNDMWAIAKEKYGTANEVRNVEAYYNMMSLDGSKENQELLLTVPYTLSNKDNMVSWLAVQNSWENYGKLICYKFPKDINVYGPLQIENRIDSDTTIARELTLWGQGGSKVVRGNMMVVPVENSLLYVEPLYIKSNNESSLPELKQVIVAYADKIVMRPTLEEAIYALFNVQAPIASSTTSVASDLEEEQVIERVIAAFRAVKAASAQSDWETFGHSMKALEDVIGELEQNEETTTPQE